MITRARTCQFLAVCALLIGCESAEEKCARLQKEAASAWGAYAAVLEKGRVDAQRAHDAAKAKAEAIEQRLAADARTEADRLYEPKSSAWWRAVDATQQTLCTKDAECIELKTATAQANETLEELAARLTAVRAVEATASAAAADIERAPAAASAIEAVEDDFDRPEIKPARAATAVANEACADVTR
jgi:hypothetical protein